ncbi:MAG: winged helix-turn-helix domain-containing protein [Acidiferrobacteraceae bacterium]
MRPPGSPKELERRRRHAIALLKEDVPPVEVARRVGVDQRSVRRWQASYRAQGEQGITARPSPGRPAVLDVKAKCQLERLLLQGAHASGFPTDLWTCPRVAQLIEAAFGVCYHVDHIGRLLHGLGWSPQKPEHRTLRCNEGEGRRWIKAV